MFIFKMIWKVKFASAPILIDEEASACYTDTNQTRKFTVGDARYYQERFRAANAPNTTYVHTLYGRVLLYKYLWSLDLSDFPTRSDLNGGAKKSRPKKIIKKPNDNIITILFISDKNMLYSPFCIFYF